MYAYRAEEYKEKTGVKNRERVEAMIEEKIVRITPGMPQYPALLKEIRDYPKELFCIGDVKLLASRCLAVIGSRNTTGYGRSTAVKLAKRAASADITVVSGMARGIDTCAHRGTLDGGGKTIAVLGCGVDICYPSENSALKEEIEHKGLVISEYLPGTEPRKYFFPQRNRIISGISQAAVVVQAGNDSGALITAELAAEQGREVCAVPGNIDSIYNLGNNKLIREGALPIISTGDILEIMKVKAAAEEELQKLMGGIEKQVYFQLEAHGEMTVDQLCRALGKPPSYMAGVLSVMEMKGIVFSELGKIFIAKG